MFNNILTSCWGIVHRIVQVGGDLLTSFSSTSCLEWARLQNQLKLSAQYFQNLQGWEFREFSGQLPVFNQLPGEAFALANLRISLAAPCDCSCLSFLSFFYFLTSEKTGSVFLCNFPLCSLRQPATFPPSFFFLFFCFKPNFLIFLLYVMSFSPFAS